MDEKIDRTLDYHKIWAKEAEVITDFISLKDDTIKLSDKNGDIRMKENEIEINTTFDEFSKAMNELKGRLEHFKLEGNKLNKKTVKLVSKIADQEIPKEIQDRIDSREKTIKLVATILKWVKKLLKSGLEKREHDTVQNPFEDLRKLIQRLNIDRSPKLLEIRIKI